MLCNVLCLNKIVLRKKNSAELASKLDTDEEGIYELEDNSKEIIKKGWGYSSVIELLPRNNQECNTRSKLRHIKNYQKLCAESQGSLIEISKLVFGDILFKISQNW